MRSWFPVTYARASQCRQLPESAGLATQQAWYCTRMRYPLLAAAVFSACSPAAAPPAAVAPAGTAPVPAPVPPPAPPAAAPPVAVAPAGTAPVPAPVPPPPIMTCTNEGYSFNVTGRVVLTVLELGGDPTAINGNTDLHIQRAGGEELGDHEFVRFAVREDGGSLGFRDKNRDRRSEWEVPMQSGFRIRAYHNDQPVPGGPTVAKGLAGTDNCKRFPTDGSEAYFGSTHGYHLKLGLRLIQP